MIEHDLIKWIINTLKHEKSSLSQFSYEYMTALLMNLSLREKGKQKCEEPIDVIPTLIGLLDHENIQVKTFIRGLFYSLMSRKKLRQEANVRDFCITL